MSYIQNGGGAYEQCALRQASQMSANRVQKNAPKELIRRVLGSPERWLIVCAVITLAGQTTMLLAAASLARFGNSDKLQQFLDLLTGTAMLSFFSTAVILLAVRNLNATFRKHSIELRDFLSRNREYEFNGNRNSVAELQWMSSKAIQLAGAVIEREAAIADHSLDLLLSMNEAGQIIAVNQAALRHVGQHPYQLLYKHFSTLVQKSDLSNFQQAMMRASSNTGQFEVIAGVEASENQPAKIFCWTIEFSATHRTYFCAAKDVSEKMQLERFKQDFTSMVIHDLRSPISSAVMTMQLVLTDAWEPLAESHRVQIARCSRAMGRLLSLINSLLDLNKLEAGKFKLHIELVRLSTIVEESVSTVATYAQQNQVTIDTTGNLNDKVAVDEERIVQVLVNLLSNAIKYSPPEAKVTISAYRGERLVTIIVTDEGPGIPESHRSRIFERYEQLGEGERAGATGLGLYICKAIVERHGGNIGVRSEVGAGSQFWFTIPCPSTVPDPELD